MQIGSAICILFSFKAGLGNWLTKLGLSSWIRMNKSVSTLVRDICSVANIQILLPLVSRKLPHLFFSSRTIVVSELLSKA